MKLRQFFYLLTLRVGAAPLSSVDTLCNSSRIQPHRCLFSASNIAALSDRTFSLAPDFLRLRRDIL